MRKFISLQLLIIALVIGVFMGTAYPSDFTETAIDYVNNSFLEQGAKEAIITTISNDSDAQIWLTKFNDIYYSLSVVQVPPTKNKKIAFVKTLERDTMKIALLKAETNIALHFDNGRLNRKIFSDKEAADYALRVSYSAKIKGLQSSSKVIDKVAI